MSSNVRDFGAKGDGVKDDTDAIQHAVNQGEGEIEFPRGEYRISRPIVVRLKETGRTSLHGSGGTAKLLHHGAGPAISLLGSHGKTADPSGFEPVVWSRERLPTVRDIEIEGHHAEADGIRVEGVMQPTITGVLLRRLRHGIIATNRARNLLISHCHIYHNTGIGVWLESVNLHQAIITGSHISYCRLGGIRIEGKTEVRNLQITGCDIEYNNNRSHMVPGADAEPTAEIYIDASQGSVREATISSCTIQATYSPKGCNIRLIGHNPEQNHKVGLLTISGNLIGSQENNIHLTAARGVTIAGNVIYSGMGRNLLVENSRNIVIGSNCFDHNPDYRDKELCPGIRLVDSVDCALSGVVIQDAQAGKHTVAGAPPLERTALIELVRCRRTNLNGLVVTDGAPYGIDVEECHDTVITGSTILEGRGEKLMKAAIRWRGPGTGNLINGCRLGRGTDGTVVSDKGVVRQWENLPDPTA